MRLNFMMSGVATGLRRNLSMTIALILSTAISLGFLGAALVASTFIQDFRDKYEDQLSVTIYLCPTINSDSDTQCAAGRYTDAQQSALAAKLRDDDRIASFTFFTEQQSYQRAKATLPEATADNLEVGVIPALFQLKLKNIQRDYDGVSASYEKAPGVQSVQNQSDELRTLLDLFGQVRTASFVVAIIVLISAIILMANTIQVAAQHRRNETSIMRLVGASRWVTQLPFIIEAVIAAVVGGIIGTAFVFVGRSLFFYRVFGDQVKSRIFPPIEVSTVLTWGAAGIGVGIVLAALTAWATLRLSVKL
ncbi:permease-like cell division protein FtsX [Jatrophihabitans sp. YIM 134969]